MAQRTKKRAKKQAPKRRTRARPTTVGKRWSQRVTEFSHALDLEPGVFKKASPRAIAQSLERAAKRSKRRKADPFQSALSMLSFYINRAGRELPAARKRVLTAAKDELRRIFGREQHAA